MLNFNTFRVLRANGYRSMYNGGGGGGSSDSSTSTSSSTSNNIRTTDRRGVASENANAITGDSNNVVRNTTISTSDFGSIAASLNLAGNISGVAIGQVGATADKAIGLGGMAVNGALDVMKAQVSSLNRTTDNVFNFAAQAGTNALTSSRDIIGLAQSTTSAIGAATKAATDSATGNRTVVLTALAIVGVVAAAFIFKKA